MSQIDPRMIRGRSEGIQADDRSQRWKVLRLPRRSKDQMVIRLDLRYGSISLVESRLSIAAGNTRRTWRGVLSMGDSIDRSRVSLDWGGEREEGVDDVGRREAGLMTSAMSGLAISDRCTVI